MRRHSLAAVLALGLLLCGPGTAKAEQVDNPSFKSWSRFKVGTWVTVKQVSESGASKSELETTFTLVELTPDHLVLESKAKMTVGGKLFEIAPKRGDPIAAKVDRVESAAKGETKKLAEGDEDLALNGKTVKCHWIETETESSGMKTRGKTWMSDEIPSGMAKMETKTEGATKSSMSQVVLSWETK
jgi:hypothetical protein